MAHDPDQPSWLGANFKGAIIIPKHPRTNLPEGGGMIDCIFVYLPCGVWIRSHLHIVMVSETFPTPFPQDQGWTPGLRHTFDDRKEKYQPWGSICMDGLPPLLYPPHLPYAPPPPPLRDQLRWGVRGPSCTSSTMPGAPADPVPCPTRPVKRCRDPLFFEA